MIASGGAVRGFDEPVPRAPDLLPVPRELRSLPWDLAQDELGVATTDFIAVVACLILRLAKDQIGAQLPDT